MDSKQRAIGVVIPFLKFLTDSKQRAMGIAITPLKFVRKNPHDNMGVIVISERKKGLRNSENFAALKSAAYKVLRGAGAFSKAARIIPSV